MGCETGGLRSILGFNVSTGPVTLGDGPFFAADSGAGVLSSVWITCVLAAGPFEIRVCFVVGALAALRGGGEMILDAVLGSASSESCSGSSACSTFACDIDGNEAFEDSLLAFLSKEWSWFSALTRRRFRG